MFILVVNKGGGTLTKSKKSVFIILVVLFLVVALIFGIILWCLSSGYNPGDECIYYDELSTVMKDNIVYLSNEFCEENQLFVLGIQRGIVKGKPDGEIIGEVWISYNRKHVKNCEDYSAIAKNSESIRYSFSSKEDSKMIPADIQVYVYTKENKDINYEFEYGGYKYAKYESTDNKKCYTIMTSPRKRATCRLALAISIKEDVADNYTEEQKNARIEQIFQSAVDNIVLYQG